MKKRIGMVTIGQSPRRDVVPEILQVLGDAYAAVEAGALDGLTPQEVMKFRPGKGDYVLVTRLADGSEVLVAERYITPLVQHKVNMLFAQGLQLVVLLCTGEFPVFEVQGLLLRSQEILNRVAASLGRGCRLGVLCPTPEHVTQAIHTWSALSTTMPLVAPASPYHDLKEVEAVALELKHAGAELLLLDCIAYTLEAQEHIRKITGLPVLAPRGLVASLIKELLG